MGNLLVLTSLQTLDVDGLFDLQEANTMDTPSHQAR